MTFWSVFVLIRNVVNELTQQLSNSVVQETTSKILVLVDFVNRFKVQKTQKTELCLNSAKKSRFQ